MEDIRIIKKLRKKYRNMIQQHFDDDIISEDDLLQDTIKVLLENPNIPYKIIPIMAYIVSIISTLMCRNHYSVDILISIVLSYLFSSVIIK